MNGKDYEVRHFAEDGRTGQQFRRARVRNLMTEATETVHPGDWPVEVIAELLRLTHRLHSSRVFGGVQDHEQPDPTREEIAREAAKIRAENATELRKGK